jgi:hypothetical protein
MDSNDSLLCFFLALSVVVALSSQNSNADGYSTSRWKKNDGGYSIPLFSCIAQCFGKSI